MMFIYPVSNALPSNCSCQNSMDCSNNTSYFTMVRSVQKVTATICIFIAIITISGNGLVLLAMVKSKTLRTPTNLFISSLSVADLLIGTIAMPISIAGTFSKPQWFYSRLFDFMLSQSFTASTFNLSVVSFDRFVAVSFPLRYRTIMTKQKTIVAIIFIWLTSLLLSSINLVDFKLSRQRDELRLIFSILMFIIPFLIILYFYWRIFKVADRQAVTIKSQSRVFQIHIEMTNNPWKERRAAITIFIIVGIFAVCWIPNVIMAIIQVCLDVPNTCDPNRYKIECGWWVTMTIAFANSSLNPFIYAIRNYEFRKAYKKAIFGR